MSVAEIPLSPFAQTFRITIGKSEYIITQRWCVNADAWYVNVDNAEGTPLLSGLMLVTGTDLLSQFKHLGIEGELIVQSDNSVDEVPAFDTMGVSGHLFLRTP